MPVTKLPSAFPAYPRREIRFHLMNLAVRLMPTGWKYWGNSILLKTPLSESEPIAMPEPYDWIWAGPDQIAYMDRHPEATSPSAYGRRAARGDRCLCIMQGAELVGYQWVTRRSGCVLCGFGPRMEITPFPLAPDQAFAYDLYAYQNYRARGIGTMLKRLLYQTMKQEGVREVLALVAPDNHAALRVQLRLGAQAERMVYSYRIRNWSKTFLGPRGDMRLKKWTQQFMLYSGDRP